MLRWTSSGAVSDPTTLQIRVAPAFPGRISAGAPQPQRAMRCDEALDNVRYFAIERASPRTPACHDLVLSGIDDETGWSDVVSKSRAMGIRRVVWHQGDLQRCSGLADHVDRVVRVLRHPDQWQLKLGRRAPDSLVIPLEVDVLPLLDPIVDALVRTTAGEVAFQWPFPSAGVLPPPAPVAAHAVRSVVQRLENAGLRVRVSGLPPCVLSRGSIAGAWVARTRRSRNRWYVDADHQRDQALSFFPDVVRYAKPDSCRFCAVGHRCDGVVESWLSLGITGPLTPLGDG